MYIKKLKIKNFRSFGEQEEIIELGDLTTFIGANSSGKTAALLALEKLFGSNMRKRELKRADFHVPEGMKSEDLTEQSLYIEAIICFPELDSSQTMEAAKSTVPEWVRHMTVDAPDGSLYIRFRLEATWKKGISLEGNIDQKYWFVMLPETQEAEDLSNYMKPIGSQRSFIEIIYVPAIRNPLTQLKNASGTILGRVWRGIAWPEGINNEISEGGQAIEGTLKNVNGFGLMQRVMNTQWDHLHNDVRYNHVSLTLGTTEVDAVLQKLDVRFSPAEVPGDYSADALGEGLQSLFYLSLVNSLLEVEAKSFKESERIKAREEKIGEEESKSDESQTGSGRIFKEDFRPPPLTILAIEEPENHISPHLLGCVVGRLTAIAKQPNAQVLVSSHSPGIVRRVDPESIRYFRICHERLCSLVRSLTLPSRVDAAYKFVKEAVIAYPEIYFARLVVLGEGDTEEIIIPRVLRLLGRSLDKNSISVVPLGGRFVNHFWKLLNGLNIPHVTLLDLDLGRGTGGWERIKYIVQKLIENGVDESELFGVLDIPDDNYLRDMHKLPIDRDKIMEKAHLLENYNVFFAAPLDMDFLMLSAFEDDYKSTAPARGGPQIPDENENQED